MSNDPRNDLFHLLGMLESLLKIQKYTQDIHSTEELLEKEDQMVFNACLTLLANLSTIMLGLTRLSFTTL